MAMSLTGGLLNTAMIGMSSDSSAWVESAFRSDGARAFLPQGTRSEPSVGGASPRVPPVAPSRGSPAIKIRGILLETECEGAEPC